ncbi:GNAT family N-acetyltransferase [Novosphingobium lentum]|uniref:GNAT family N-acetyltransferase n=1 Tax=Novosphingobium lentum TaxID=145287 RepID=UPI0008338AE1|nr:GNAT family N-acetyltransferase [Novosphingobium lentum]
MTGPATVPFVETARLHLRSWRDDDVVPFQAISSDPLVMATLGPLMDLAETRALIERCRALQARDGHCFWAMERREDQRLIGWCGVIRGSVGPIEGKAELGWRLASDCWGHGFASEAARGALDWVFANLPDDAAYAITNVDNRRSRAVMERMGMRWQPDLDFDHPRLTADDPLLRHVTYRLDRTDWPVPRR